MCQTSWSHVIICHPLGPLLIVIATAAPMRLMSSFSFFLFLSILHQLKFSWQYAFIGCHGTDKSRSLEAHKRTCRSHKIQSGKLKTLIQTLSLSAHRNHTKALGIQHKIPGRPEVLGNKIPEHPESPKRNRDEQHEQCVSNSVIFIFLKTIYMQLPSGPSPPMQDYHPDVRPKRNTCLQVSQRFCDDLPPRPPPMILGPIPFAGIQTWAINHGGGVVVYDGLGCGVHWLRGWL